MNVSASDFKEILLVLSREKHAIVFKALPVRIESIKDFLSLRFLLNEEQRSILFRANLDLIGSGINRPEDCGQVFSCLDEETLILACESIKDRLGQIFKKTGDFTHALLCITDPERRQVVNTVLKNQLPAMINNADDFRNILFCRSSEQCADLTRDISEKLPTIIATIPALHEALSLLSTAQRFAVYDSAKDHIFSIIKTGQDFAWFHSYFRIASPPANPSLYEVYKDKLADIIHSATDFKMVNKWLDENERRAVFNTVNNQLPSMIKTATDLDEVLEYLGLEQAFELIPQLTAAPLNVMRLITYMQRNSVPGPSANDTATNLKRLKESLVPFINSANDLECLMGHLSEQPAASYDSNNIQLACKTAIDQYKCLEKDPNSTASKADLAFAEVLFLQGLYFESKLKAFLFSFDTSYRQHSLSRCILSELFKTEAGFAYLHRPFPKVVEVDWRVEFYAEQRRKSEQAGAEYRRKKAQENAALAHEEAMRYANKKKKGPK